MANIAISDIKVAGSTLLTELTEAEMQISGGGHGKGRGRRGGSGSGKKNRGGSGSRKKNRGGRGGYGGNGCGCFSGH